MRGMVSVVLLAALAAPGSAQTRKPVRRPAAAPLAPPKKEAADLICPPPLRVGVKTKLALCDVMSGRDPAGGALVNTPHHPRPVALPFALHNRHTYSQEQVEANRAFSRHTATLG